MKNKIILPLLIFIIGCVTIYNPATQKQESYFISEEQEIAIGKNITNSIIEQKKLIVDKNLVNFVRNIGDKVAAASDRKELSYNFYILDEKEMNAFAIPGGYIFVNKGLVDKLNEDELAFVLAHEIGHVAARHSLKRLQAALGVNILMSIALGSSSQAAARQGAGIIYSVVENGYSRQDELLADYLGAKYIKRAGYDPHGAIAALKKLQNEIKDNASFSFLSSHPATKERIKQLEKKIGELTPE
jgi:predicted Zn-dependent protease